MQTCILASASPRRREILQTLGLPFTVFVTDADETCNERNPEILSEILSSRKGEAAVKELKKADRLPQDTLVIASDTTVFIDGEILGKPKDDADARRMLRLLSGRKHCVVSGIYLWMNGVSAVSHEVTEVDFDLLTEEQIDRYLATGEPFGKAGAYAIQGKGCVFIKSIRGDYFNVVGLPAKRMADLYRQTFGKDLI